MHAPSSRTRLPRPLWPALAAPVLFALLVVSSADAGAARPRCDGFAATIVGGPRADRLRGTAGPDVIVGRGGNDVIRGLDGLDRICGNGGNDVLRGGDAGDRLDGGAGSDRIDGGLLFDDVLFGGAPGPVKVNLTTGRASGYGRDRLVGIEDVYGSRHDDVIRGGDSFIEVLWGDAGNDVVKGGPAASIVHGNEGEDQLFGGAGGDLLLGGPGDDTMDGGADSDVAGFLEAAGPVEASLVAGTSTGQGSDSFTTVEGLLGSGFDDRLTGDGADNELDGVAGADTIVGGDGADYVQGGLGADTVDAGAGDDTVFGEDDDDVIDGGPGEDGLSGGRGTDTCDNGERFSGCESGSPPPPDGLPGRVMRPDPDGSQRLMRIFLTWRSWDGPDVRKVG
jgi:Ca2+-binding RTX toxin-like protein